MLLEEYKESWIEDFNQIREVINKELLNLKVSIEHIGSTSVPGLAAKPIIDIDVVFAEHAEFEEIKKRLEKIGYHHNGNQGITDREVFKRNIAAARHIVLDFINHHLYVCPINSKELQKHILFRDYLVSNEEARAEYQHLKYQIAEEANQERKKYAQLKEMKAEKFIDIIISKAIIRKTTSLYIDLTKRSG
jgi:GrpB-like predicted nucleotidyltransferase (UPF0157 family)